MREPTTYWDACIACLPAEKRALAERAYQEIASGGENGLFPKVLLLLEAHAAYTNTIPARITEAAEGAVSQMRELAQSNTGNGGLCAEDMDKLIKAVRESSRPDAVQAAKAALSENVHGIRQLNQQISRLRNFRVGMALFLMCLTATATTGALWYLNREKLQAVNELERSGVALTTERTETSLNVCVQGPLEGVVRVSDVQVPGVIAKFRLK